MTAFEIIGQVEAMEAEYVVRFHRHPTCVYLGRHQYELVMAAAYHICLFADPGQQEARLNGLEVISVAKPDHLDVGGDRLSVGELFQKMEP